MSLPCCHLPSIAKISLHRNQHKLRVTNVRTDRLDRKTELLVTASQSAAQVAKAESRAQAVFAEHLKTQGSTSTTEGATGLLRQAAVSRNVPPYKTLGAALHVEQQCHRNTGVIQ